MKCVFRLTSLIIYWTLWISSFPFEIVSDTIIFGYFPVKKDCSPFRLELNSCSDTQSCESRCSRHYSSGLQTFLLVYVSKGPYHCHYLWSHRLSVYVSICVASWVDNECVFNSFLLLPFLFLLDLFSPVAFYCSVSRILIYLMHIYMQAV